MYKNTIRACCSFKCQIKVISKCNVYIYSPYFSDISKINIAFAAKDR